ncbi:hypothetical protein BDR22DRAFT_853453 [Usnea florida]
MFFPFCFITSLVFLVSIVASSALPSLPTLISDSLNVPATSHPPAAINTSQQDLNISASSYDPECSTLYGTILNYASCQDALAKISRATLPLTFGQRGTGNWDVLLPRRYLSDDGYCAIDIKVDLNGAQKDVSNYLQLTNAAGAILRDCVAPPRPSTGGLVNQLGIKYRSLSVEMSRYSPKVVCHRGSRRLPPSYNSCKQMLDTMQWSNTMTEFGLPWQPRAQIHLPYVFSSMDRQCKLFVTNKVPSPVDTSTWASIWSEAVAINEMCVRSGSNGNGIPKSLKSNLVVFLFGRGKILPLEMLSSLNLTSSDLSMLSTFNTTSPSSEV